jgi:hypothetical protein
MGRSLKVFKKNVFSCFWLGCLRMTTMETRKRSDGNVMVFMAFMFLCHFFKFGMTELKWILLDARELPSNGESVEFSLWS